MEASASAYQSLGHNNDRDCSLILHCWDYSPCLGLFIGLCLKWSNVKAGGGEWGCGMEQQIKLLVQATSSVKKKCEEPVSLPE